MSKPCQVIQLTFQLSITQPRDTNIRWRSNRDNFFSPPLQSWIWLPLTPASGYGMIPSLPALIICHHQSVSLRRKRLSPLVFIAIVVVLVGQPATSSLAKSLFLPRRLVGSLLAIVHIWFDTRGVRALTTRWQDRSWGKNKKGGRKRIIQFYRNTELYFGSQQVVCRI